MKTSETPLAEDVENLSTNKIQKSSHYVDNKKFLQALIEYRQSVDEASAKGEEPPIVSKYIGETEKNLSRLLDIAEHKNWVLFFDEADSLFSKRTEVNDSKDKYANQGTSYLLQRLEEYDGLVILATNLRPNIDRAFIRRFQSILFFNLPTVEERIKLWENALKNFTISKDVSIKKIAEKYEVSGASIGNAIQFSWLSSKRDLRNEISELDIEAGLLREMAKEGRAVK